MHAHEHHHHEDAHPCPRSGKCCGRCKLAVPGKLAGRMEGQTSVVPANVPALKPAYILVHDFAD